jgi:DNA-directed RNA polymerase specialized sigma24 family protein
MTGHQESQHPDFCGHARTILGPLSEALCARPDVQARMAARHARGATLEDVVLAEAHAAAARDTGIANEFFCAILPDLGKLASSKLSSNLRQHLEAGDILQSVVTDIWRRFTGIEFRTKAEYLSLVNERLRWKAIDRGKPLAKRPSPQSLESIDDRSLPATDTKAPITAVIEHERLARLRVVLICLPERDRLILTRLLKGDNVRDIARALGLRLNSAARAIARTTARARKILNEDAPPG